MKAKTQFDSENILMSVFGHLVLFSIMIFSFSFVVERAKLVTPNRIEIVELDLKSVKISGDETKLYNTVQPKTDEVQKDDKKDTKQPDAENKKIDLKQPTMVENESKKLDKEKSVKKDKAKDENTPAPRKKKTVKVNREVLSLDRTMTVSVVDALRVAMTRCWVVDTNRPDVADIRLTAHLKMLPSGMVETMWFESESRAKTDEAYAYVLDTAKTAIKTCQPFSMLPRTEYEKWADIVLTFYPSNGKVM